MGPLCCDLPDRGQTTTFRSPKAVAEVFLRPRLAVELASRLLRPGVLDESLRSRLFLSGSRRTDKTTLLRTDLVPELEAQGAVVIYGVLWSDTKVSPAALVQAMVRQTLTQLAMPSSPLLARLKRIKGLDQLLPVIAATLRSSAADLELLKVDQIGGLATAIVDRVGRSEGPARGIFSAEAAAAYGEAISRAVRLEEIQPVVNELLSANVLMRLGHGLYEVTDPFVQEIWRERQG
jgi:hypothetical protein